MPQTKPGGSSKKLQKSNPLIPVDPYIIAIGASAGGLEALQEFLSHLPEIKNAAIIVAQHLSPTHKSMLVQLLSRETKLQVAEAENGATLEANKIYITPPDKEISISAGRIVLKKPQSSVGPKPSVDVLFTSLAEGAAHRVLGIILSGTGSDGASGVRMLKKNGGFIIAQEPHTAKYDGMPLAAIETGEVDLVLPPEKMGEEILEHFLNPGHIRIKQAEADNSGSSLEKIIRVLSKRTGTDFSNYKSATIIRRLEKRLAILKIKSIDAYLKLLEESPREQDEMFNMILIGVTTFFRDIEAFGALENTLHKIINAKTNKEPIRIWVPGCYTGEEAYSIAILLSRILKERTQNYNIQIFATDIDEKAIASARRGVYSASSLENVPKEIIENYFIHDGKQYELVKSVRSMVLFSRHDLTNNPPFLKLDLISCRNLLIYFGASLQQQIIPIFHYALLQDAYLFLGKSETVGQYSDLFATVDGKYKIYQRKRGGNLHSIKFSAFKAQKQTLPQHSVKKLKKDLSISDLVKETIFNTYEHPYVVINDEFDILEINGDVRLFMTLTQGSVQVNLLKMINPELQIEIRSVITKAIKVRESVRSSIKKFELFGNSYYVRITTKPLIFTETSEELFIVIFERLDLEEFVSKGIVTDEKELVDVRLQELEHELAATKEHLQTYIEELETSNEEMQSLNEEMQSTNEELQSSNEELETSNEELQSTNEEIQITYSELKAVNHELERKEIALKENDANIIALLNNKLQAFVLIDSTYKVIKFNEKAEELFLELRNKKIKNNDSFIDLVEPGQLELFVRDFTKTLKGESISREMKLTGYTGSDHWYSLNYTPVSTVDRNVNGISIGILDITDLKIALTNLNEKEKMLSSVYNATSIGLCVTDDTGVFIQVNDAYCNIYGYQPDELIGNHVTLLVDPKNRKATQERHQQFIKSGKEIPGEWEMIKKDGSTIQIYATAELLVLPNGKRLKITSERDITEQKNSQELVNASRLKYKALIDNSLSAIFLTRPDGAIIEANPAAELLFGYTLDELIKIGRQGIIDHSKESGISELLIKREVDGRVSGELTGIRRNGEKFPLEFTSVIFKDKNNETYTYTILNDITEKKAVQQQLETNEKRFRAMVENGSDAIVIVDASANPLYISPGVNRIVGYTEQEALQLDSFNTIHPDDGDYIRTKIQESLNKPGIPIKDLSYRIKHKDGRWLSIEATITNLLHEPAIGGIVTNFSDVTQRKQIEAQLTSITDNLNGVVFRYKLNNDGTDEMMYLSKGSIDLWGIQAEDAMQKNELIWNLFHPDDLPAVINSIQLSKENLQEWTSEWRVNHPDGTIHWQRGVGNPQLLPDGSVIWDSLIIDITKLKKQELELSRVKLNQESLINATTDLVWSVDANLQIITANEAYLQTLSYATKRPIKEGDPVIIEEFGEELVNKWKQYYHRALQGEKYSIEEQVYNPVKQAFEHGLISFNPMYNADGSIMGVSCYSKDITELVNKQQEVLNTKIELDKIMNSSPDVVCTINEAGEFVKLSAASENIWGYKPEELIGRKYMDLVHPDDLEKTNLAAAAITSGQDMTNFENRYIRKDGTEVPIIWSAKWDDHEKLMFCIAKDGTEKMLADLKILQSENRFKSLVQDGSDLIGILDLEANYTYVSPTAYQILGFLPEEFIGKNAFEFIHPDDKENTMAVFAQLSENKKIAVPPFRFKNKTGQWRWIETSLTNMLDEPSINGLVANSRDITDRMEAEQLVIESEKKYKDLFENNPSPMFIWEFASKQIIDCNIESLRQYGYSREEFLQLSINEIRPKEDIAELDKATANEETYGNIHSRTWRHLRKNGELFFVEVNGHLINYNGVKASLVMVTDITEKLKAEEELKQSEAFLAEAQRVAKLGSWNFDFRNDKLTWSDELYEVFGTDKETFKETHGTFVQLIDEEDQAFVQETSKRAQELGEPFNIEYHITTPAGEKRIIEEFGNVEKDEKGKIVRLYGTAQDITERKTAEEKIKESNQRYENVTKATYDAIWDWDVTNNKLYWGDMYTKLFGEMNDNHLSDLEKVSARLHPDEIVLVLASAKAAIKGKDLNWTYEHRYRKADGTYAFVSNKALIIRDIKQKATRVTGAMQDISKQKQEEQRLKLMSSVVTNTNDSILITEAEPIDEPGPRIIYANDAFINMTGYTLEEVIGNTPRMLQGPKSDKAELKRLSTALRNWEPCEITTINYKKNGEEFWVNFAVSPVADKNGWFTHWISIQRDVTQQKNAEIQKNLLNKITQVFNEPGNLVTTLEKVLHQITSFGGFSFAEAWLVAADGKAINKMAVHAETEAMKLFLTESADIKSFKKGEGMAGIAWETKTMQRWTDVDKRKEFIRYKAAKKAGLKTALALPLFHNFEVIGVLTIGLDQHESALSAFQALLGDLGNYIGSEINRKQLEQELHQLFSFAPDIIAIAGMDGYFKKINPATTKLLEYSETELLSSPFVDFIHPDDRNKTADELQSLIGGNPTFYFQNRYITKSGKIKWLAWTAAPSPQESIIFAVAKDITEKKELEDLLQKANQMARIGGWEVDLLKSSIFWSAITKEIHEVGVDFVPEMDTAINFYKEGENREKIKGLLQVAMENGQPWDEELQIITGKGNERWVRAIGKAEIVNGKCIRIVGSFQDIDERKKSAMAVTQTLEEKNNILESIGDAFFAVDKNWIVTYWNQVAEKVLGMRREHIVGKYLWDLYEDAVDTDFYKFYHLAVTENKVQQFEARYETLNLWIEVSAYPSPNGLSIYFKDITERKISELKLQELNENLQKQAQELEVSNRELEQFAFVASHDLQEPLRMVSSFLTQLNRKYDHVLDDKAKKYIGFATDGAARMRELILDLLEYSKIGRVNEDVAQVDLNELIEEIKVLSSNQIEETKARIISGNLPTVQLYKTPLRQVFQNLISNALKYSKSNVSPSIEINAVDKKTHWLFSVSDNGIGIGVEYFDKIFIIFQRLHNKDQYSGTGMGLAITKKIIESFNGKIWVESREGQGSTFYFTIPKK